MQERSAVLHQTLHGYSDGHRLLSSSISLPTTTEQTMLALSDLSGHGKINNFDEYITGYPLNEISCYALAKTWYANEMPRPGCVWTQTILIPFTILASVRNLESLKHYFNRPSLDSITSFNEPLLTSSFEKTPLHNQPGTFNDVSRVSEIISKLYESATSPILVPISSPVEIESMFFAIWTQQWPRLRRAFMFCTGAIAGRRLGKKWFDLQAVPHKRIDELSQSIENALVARIEEDFTLVSASPWIKAVLVDLENAVHQHGLQDFLFEYGAEADGGRGDFPQLVNVFISLTKFDNTERSALALIKALENIYPSKEQGIKLKRRLVTGSRVQNSSKDIAWVLSLLLVAKKNTFDFQILDIKPMIKDVWERNPETLVTSLETALRSRRRPNPIVLTTIASVVQPKKLVHYSNTAKNAVLALVSHSPILLVNSAFSEFESRHDLLAEFISKKGTSKNDIHQVLKLWVIEGERSLILDSAKNNPQIILTAILNLLADSEKLTDSFSFSDLQSLLTIDTEVVAQWLKSKHKKVLSNSVPLRVIANVAIAISESQIHLDKTFADIYAQLISGYNELISEPLVRKAFILKIYQFSMQESSGQGARIATLAFPHVHQMLMLQELSHLEWMDLRPSIVNQETDSNWLWGWNFDWDYCRALREGLIDRFIKFNWPQNYFARLIEDEPLGSFFRDSYYHKDRQYDFVRNFWPDAIKE